MRWIVPVLSLACTALAQTPMDIQRQAACARNSLATCGYTPLERGGALLKSLPAKEQITGSFMRPYTIFGKKGKTVSWFGVLRGISASGGHLTLLIEHKYFDGMTDCHIMLVSHAGGGDFQAALEADPKNLPALSLVRVYGTVKERTGKIR